MRITKQSGGSPGSSNKAKLERHEIEMQGFGRVLRELTRPSEKQADSIHNRGKIRSSSRSCWADEGGWFEVLARFNCVCHTPHTHG